MKIKIDEQFWTNLVIHVVGGVITILILRWWKD